MARSGYYEDPLGRHFSRFYNGRGWAYLVRDEAGVEQVLYDADLNDDFLKTLEAPSTPPIEKDTETPGFRDDHWSLAFGDYWTSVDGLGGLNPFGTRRNKKPKGGANSDGNARNWKPRIGFSTSALSENWDELKNSSVSSTIDEVFRPSAINNYSVDPREEGWIVGQTGMVRLRDGLVEIQRTSLWADQLLGNLRGDKAIPIRNIQAVQFKPASQTVGGMIEFVVAGDRTNTGQQRNNKILISRLLNRRVQRMANENVLTFSRSQEQPFIEFHKLILNEIRKIGIPQPTVAPTAVRGISVEVRELKALLDDGLITEIEFEKLKQKILDQ